MTFERFAPIMSINKTDTYVIMNDSTNLFYFNGKHLNFSREMRIKQRVILKFLMYLSSRMFMMCVNKNSFLFLFFYFVKLSYRRGNSIDQDDSLRQQLIKIIKLFYTFAYIDGEALSQDKSILMIWEAFNMKIPSRIRAIHSFVSANLSCGLSIDRKSNLFS